MCVCVRVYACVSVSACVHVLLSVHEVSLPHLSISSVFLISLIALSYLVGRHAGDVVIEGGNGLTTLGGGITEELG